MGNNAEIMLEYYGLFVYPYKETQQRSYVIRGYCFTVGRRIVIVGLQILYSNLCNPWQVIKDF